MLLQIVITCLTYQKISYTSLDIVKRQQYKVAETEYLCLDFKKTTVHVKCKNKLRRTANKFRTNVQQFHS